MIKERSLYIHIPFCDTHCSYCDFAVILDPKASRYQLYTDALCQEIEYYANQNIILNTIYFGGGTPSILKIEQLQKILNCIKNSFQIKNNAEITIELNPITSESAKLKEFFQMGINRLSIGIQTFQEEALKKLARRHRVKDINNTITWARAAGFENISIDLIYGLPQQTITEWGENIEKALELDIEHISAYALSVEPNTPYWKMYNGGEHKDIPTVEIYEQMYLVLNQRLKAAGYEHYEISNWAKNKQYSAHNLAYWQMKEYYACGLAAHGYIDDQRYSHTRNTTEYINNPTAIISEPVDPLTEYIMLGLRTQWGIDLKYLQEYYQLDLNEKKEKLLARYIQQELLYLKDNHLILTDRGMYISNEIILNLLS